MDPGDQLGLFAIIFVYIVVIGGGTLLALLFNGARKLTGKPTDNLPVDSNGAPIHKKSTFTRDLLMGIGIVIGILFLLFTIPLLFSLLYHSESASGYVQTRN